MLLEEMPEMVSGFETETLTAEEVVFPAASLARAATAWVPLVVVVVSQITVYGAVATGSPIGFPSRRNCTLVTPTLSEAEAEMVVVVPETVAPLAGAVSETVGGWVSVCGPPILICLPIEGTPFESTSHSR
jgi:hypothetical protein